MWSYDQQSYQVSMQHADSHARIAGWNPWSILQKIPQSSMLFVVSITKTVPGCLYLFETSGLLRFPNVKDRPFLSASLVANKCDGNSDFLPYICCDAILQSGGALWQVSFMNLSHDSMSLQSKEPWFIHVQVIFSGYFSSLLATLSLPLQDWLTLPLHVSSTPWGCIWSNCEFIWWFFGNILYSCL